VIEEQAALLYTRSMLTEYIEAAMRHAQYETMEDGRIFGTVPPCPGAWADGDTVEACRAELKEVVESWIIIGLRHGHCFEVIDGLDLNPQPVYAEAD
jgi:predicted RNase H-like HicB family nuclease